MTTYLTKSLHINYGNTQNMLCKAFHLEDIPFYIEFLCEYVSSVDSPAIWQQGGKKTLAGEESQLDGCTSPQSSTSYLNVKEEHPCTLSLNFTAMLYRCTTQSIIHTVSHFQSPVHCNKIVQLCRAFLTPGMKSKIFSFVKKKKQTLIRSFKSFTQEKVLRTENILNFEVIDNIQTFLKMKVSLQCS